jgi:hypothetical protein
MQIFLSPHITLEPSSLAIEYRPAHNAAQVCCIDTLLCSIFFVLSYHHFRWKGTLLSELKCCQ